MIKNFDEIKKQLAELATVVNSFKSEAVQLRIVELVLGASPDENEDETEDRPRRKKKAKHRKKAAKKKAKTKEGSSKKKRRSTGPASALSDLIDEGYFAKKHGINDIIDHCKANKARTFKANELSTPLARFVRNGRLKRETNADGQYEYFAK